MARVKRCKAITNRCSLLWVAVFELVAFAVHAKDITGVDATTLGVVINLNDAQSVAVGDYYQKRRRIPLENIIRVRFPANVNTLSESDFALAKTQIDRQTRGDIQSYVLTWLRPYRVACMSITSAMAFGFSRDYCSNACKPTRISRYFDSDSKLPMLDIGVRPAMLLAATSIAHAKTLIDRGITADGSSPKGTAYLVTTNDTSRNVRSARYTLAEAVVGDAIRIQRVNDFVSNAADVMFYFTGSLDVPDLSSNRFQPGAIGDHLTSSGGALLDTDQMSSLRWLEAGATGSYGTVVEPCNIPGKFPDPVVMMKHYLAGETLLEAYWKSVLMPGQGLFIGEPLARPYASFSVPK